MTLTFVVGSGRCGSTLLSKVLREHPEVLSLSEFFAALTFHEDVIPVGEFDGARMWEILSSTDKYIDGLVANGIVIPELCYPIGSGRYTLETGVPLISHMTLPMLTDDPDQLFDELAAEVTLWPVRPAADHYRELFALLAGRLGRRVVVERSGASLNLIPQLRREFPEARFVHMHRSGPDTALSMSKHAGFRLSALAEHAARLVGLSDRSELTPEHVPLMPAELVEVLTPPVDAERFNAYQIPLTVFGEMWSSMVCDGLRDLRTLPDDAWTSLSYEDLLSDSDAVLNRLAGFIGVPAVPGWLDTARDMLDPRRAGSASSLDSVERAELEEACAPGTEALARHSGVPVP